MLSGGYAPAVGKQGPLARLIALVHALTTSRRGIVVRQYAERTGVAVRTIYRDLGRLEEAGFPLGSEDGRYFLPASFTRLRTPGLEPDELLALYLARQTARVLRGTSAGAALDRLWAKLTSDPSGQVSLGPLGASPLTVGAGPAIDYRPHLRTIAALEDAIARRRVVHARYRSPRAAGPSERQLEPGDLHVDAPTGTLYAICWCRLRAAVRVFAVHRFLEVSVLDEVVRPRPETRSQHALRHAFRVWHAEASHRVRLRFAPAAAEEIRERRWHRSQRLTPLVAGGVVLELTVAEPLELERWLLGFGPDVEVLEPRSLAEHVRARHQAALGSGRVDRVPVDDTAWPQGGPAQMRARPLPVRRS